MIRRFMLLLVPALVSTAARADTLTFEQYDCALTLPNKRWTIDTSGADRGVLLDAFMDNRVREVRLTIAPAPEGATAINDSGYINGIVAGITEQGIITGRGFEWHNNDMCYEICYSRNEGTVKAGARYLLAIKHGRLYTLRFGARYSDPCDDRGFNTIAQSLVVANEPGEIASELLSEAEDDRNPFAPGSEEYYRIIEQQQQKARVIETVLWFFVAIVMLGVPGWLGFYFLTRKKRRLRESEFEAQLSTAPDLELARVLLNKQEYSIDAVDIAELELTRRGRKEEMLEMARTRSSREEQKWEGEPGLRLSDESIRQRLLYGAIAGSLTHLTILGIAIHSITSRQMLSGGARSGISMLFLTTIWALAGLMPSYRIRQGSRRAAALLIPSLLLIPLWTALHIESLTLLPLLVLAVPAFFTVRAIDDIRIKREQEIDLANVGWEGEV